MPGYPFLRLDFLAGYSIGPSRTTILEAIAKYGSIVAAANATGVSYRQTWSVVRLMNRQFPTPLVEVHRGGQPAGACLTPVGEALVRYYRAMERDMRVAVAPHLPKFDELLGFDPTKTMPAGAANELWQDPNE